MTSFKPEIWLTPGVRILVCRSLEVLAKELLSSGVGRKNCIKQGNWELQEACSSTQQGIKLSYWYSRYLLGKGFE